MVDEAAAAALGKRGAKVTVLEVAPSLLPRQLAPRGGDLLRRYLEGRGLTIRPIRTMINHATTEVFFDNMKVPAENLIGEEVARLDAALLEGLDHAAEADPGQTGQPAERLAGEDRPGDRTGGGDGGDGDHGAGGGVGAEQGPAEALDHPGHRIQFVHQAHGLRHQAGRIDHRRGIHHHLQQEVDREHHGQEEEQEQGNAANG